MSLPDDQQQNIQMKLDFSSALTGAARGAAGEETESPGATSGAENLAKTDRLMEEVCERENLKEALRRVKANKGSSGVDVMTVVALSDYLKRHWPAIREQLLNGTYEPKPGRRVEIPKPDGGVRKLGCFLQPSEDTGRRNRCKTFFTPDCCFRPSLRRREPSPVSRLRSRQRKRSQEVLHTLFIFPRMFSPAFRGTAGGETGARGCELIF